MRKLADQVPMEKLQESPKWLNLVEMRQKLQKLLPDDHPKFEMKRGASTMEFNGVQVRTSGRAGTRLPKYLTRTRLFQVG